MEVEYAGCHTVLRGPVCVVPEDRELRLWIQSDLGDDLIVVSGGDLLGSEKTADGRRFRVELEDGQPVLTVRLPTTASVDGTWSLALQPNDEPSWLTEVRSRGRTEPKLARQQLMERIDGLEAAHRAPALGILARLAMMAGESEEAQRRFVEATDVSRSTNDYMEEIRSRAPLIHILIANEKVSEARALLEGMPTEAGQPTEALNQLAYSRAIMANRVGDHQTALRFANEAARHVERLELNPFLSRTARQTMAIQLGRIGRGTEAAALLTELWASAPEGGDPCARAQLANNIGWNRLLALEADDEAVMAASRRHDPTSDPVPWFEKALDIFQRQCPGRANEPPNVHTNLARAHLHAGRMDMARAHVESSRRLAPEPEIRQLLWWQDIEARIALREGRPRQALELYDEMMELAVATLYAEPEWRSVIGCGRAHQALGEVDSARRDFARGEMLLDSASLQVKIGDGRANFVAQREVGTRYYLALLLDQGLEREAFEVARRSRSRILRSLRRGERLAHLEPARRRQWDETVADYLRQRQEFDAAVRDAWRLPADELRLLHEAQTLRRRELNDLRDAFLSILEPTGPSTQVLPELVPGEARLIFHPLPRAWVAFAEDAGGLQVERVPELDVEAATNAELARHLIEPFAGKIAVAERVRILAYGDLRAIDFHALSFDGDVLLAAKPVVYGLDLQATATSPGRRHGVVVADPGGDLAAARLEARHVREAAAVSWSIELLEGGAADDKAVRDALAAADLFHYAGHGIFAGWGSALPLANSSRLTLGDILALERAPAQVVLSGCDTGRSADDAPAAIAGLAHAFLAVGSHSVIAATGPIGDDAALELTTALYPALLAETSAPAALRQAQLELRRRDPGGDWSKFRVFEP